jgi:uncharacterized protein YuzE
MKIHYDPEVDVLRIIFKEATIEESDEESPGVICDFDSEGNMVGVEVLKNASLRIDNPHIVEYMLSPPTVAS